MIALGLKAAWLSAAGSEGGIGIVDANHSSHPHVPGGPPTPCVSPCIPYLPMAVQNHSRSDLHPWFEGRGQVVGTGKERECEGAKS